MTIFWKTLPGLEKKNLEFNEDWSGTYVGK